jgi:hypothetical protein
MRWIWAPALLIRLCPADECKNETHQSDPRVHMPRIDQNNLKPTSLKNLIQSNPLNPRRLHSHRLNPALLYGKWRGHSLSGRDLYPF